MGNFAINSKKITSCESNNKLSWINKLSFKLVNFNHKEQKKLFLFSSLMRFLNWKKYN